MNAKNKTVLFFLIGILLLNNSGFTQPVLEWSKSYGGSDRDIALDIDKTTDGGFIIAGWTDSVDGDVGGNYGGQDGWIVKLDSEGNLEWGKNYGGSDDETAKSIKQTTDGGFIVAGYSRSNDGDVGGNNGDQDSWVMKLDSEGNVEWSKNYGGSDRDRAVEIIEAADNGYALLSFTESIDGDVGGNNGGRDYWLVKVDDLGNLEWEQNYGSSAWDVPSSIKVVTSGGYIISGWAGINDGDVSGNYGSNDSWLVKVDNEGNLEWEKNYGGSENDVTYDMDQTNDGGYILAGRSRSNDGDVEGNNGDHDSWIMKLDNEGNLEWSKNYGGSEDEAASSIKQTPNGEYIVLSDTESNDGDVGENYGELDSWILKLDNEGNLEWEKNYGGSSFDLAGDIVQISDNEFIAAHWSTSIDGDITENNGNDDIWIIKIGSNTTSIQKSDNKSKVMISPNPSNGQFIINTNELDTPMSVSIFGAMGHSVYRKNEVHGALSIDDLPKGNYYIQIVSDEFSITEKLIVL